MNQGKVFKNAKEALNDLQSGMALMSGGFGLCGIAENCIDAIAESDVTNLTVISNNIGNSGRGLVKVLVKDKIRKATAVMLEEIQILKRECLPIK